MRLLSYEALKEEKGITYSKSQLRRLEAAGKFPGQVRPPGCRTPTWIDTEIDAHIERMIALRDGKAA